jgi:hypothetical protein
MILCLDEKRAGIKKGTQFMSAFGLTVLIFQQTNNLLSPKGDKLLLRSRRLKRCMVWRKIVNGADRMPVCRDRDVAKTGKLTRSKVTNFR